MRRHVLAALALLPLWAACQDADVSRAVGARCDRSAECDDRCLVSDNWPGGFCTLDCDRDTDCPSGTACIREDDSGVCAYTCETDRGCVFLGTGYVCTDRDSIIDGAEKVFVCRG